MNEEMIEYYRRHIIKDDDIVNFECQQCGRCCINRSDPIVINGVDFFHIVKALGITPNDAVKQHFNFNLGPTSGLPILTLKESHNGRCTLMGADGRCTVHSEKPTVCAIYPLGRFYSEEHGFEYFTQPGDDCPGYGKCRHTLKEWKEQFHIDERNEESQLWSGLIGIMRPVAKLSVGEQAMLVRYTSTIMYDFDTSRDLSVQIRERAQDAEQIAELVESYLSKEAV